MYDNSRLGRRLAVLQRICNLIQFLEVGQLRKLVTLAKFAQRVSQLWFCPNTTNPAGKML